MKKQARMTRLSGLRNSILLALVALCSMGALCNLNLLEAPPRPRGPGAVHVTVVAPFGARASGVQIQLERRASCSNFLSYCFSQPIETRSAVSNEEGDASFETMTPAFWRLKLVESDDWIPHRGEVDFWVPPGETAEVSVSVLPRP